MKLPEIYLPCVVLKNRDSSDHFLSSSTSTITYSSISSTSVYDDFYYRCIYLLLIDKVTSNIMDTRLQQWRRIFKTCLQPQIELAFMMIICYRCIYLLLTDKVKSNIMDTLFAVMKTYIENLPTASDRSVPWLREGLLWSTPQIF